MKGVWIPCEICASALNSNISEEKKKFVNPPGGYMVGEPGKGVVKLLRNLQNLHLSRGAGKRATERACVQEGFQRGQGKGQGCGLLKEREV